MELGWSWIKRWGRWLFDRATTLFSIWIWPFLESFAEVFIVIVVGIVPFLLAVRRL
jgi:hypothetical protein